MELHEDLADIKEAKERVESKGQLEKWQGIVVLALASGATIFLLVRFL